MPIDILRPIYLLTIEGHETGIYVFVVCYVVILFVGYIDSWYYSDDLWNFKNVYLVFLLFYL